MRAKTPISADKRILLGDKMRYSKCEHCGFIKTPNQLRCFCKALKNESKESKNYTIVS